MAGTVTGRMHTPGAHDRRLASVVRSTHCCFGDARACMPVRRPGGHCCARKARNEAFGLEDARHVESSHVVQWYPGHIAAAERELADRLAVVDLVVEVRDGRCPLASRHPKLQAWCRGARRVLVLNHADAVTPAERRAWSLALAGDAGGAWEGGLGLGPTWTDARHGQGVAAVESAAVAAAAALDARRSRRGLRPRAVRAAVVGFPNVGKSALINRLLRRAAADSAPRAGVTRALAWARAGAGGRLSLLDTPGVLPPSLRDQAAAARLAMCGDIGERAYLASRVAAQLLDLAGSLPRAPAILRAVEARYRIPLRDMSAEEYVECLAQRRFNAEIERAGQRILADFRALEFGRFCLEVPPSPPPV